MPTTPQKLSDAEAKQLLLRWPSHSGNVVRSSVWPTPHGSGAWLRAQPTEVGAATAPRLTAAGARSFNTQPDGLWVWLGEAAAFADVLVVEVCGTVQNLNDKRARYSATTSSLLLRIGDGWLDGELTTRGGGTRSRRALAGLGAEASPNGGLAPVRWLSVLYSLPNDVYRQWTADQTPGSHEYFCRHGSMGSYSGQPLQRLLARMTLRSHFLTEPGR